MAVSFYPHHIHDFDGPVPMRKLPMVYVLATDRFEFVKIGKSSNFKSRLSNIQSGCPHDLQLWQCIRTPKPSEIESHLHVMFEAKRARGEWFCLNDEELDALSDFCIGTNRQVREVLRALLQA